MVHRTPSVFRASLHPHRCVARKPSARVEHCCVLAGNALCLWGGNAKIEETDTLNNLYMMNRGERLSSLCVYSFMSGLLTKGNRNMPLVRSSRLQRVFDVSPPPGRHGHSLTLVGSFLVIFGGQIEGYSRNETTLFDLELLQWVQPKPSDDERSAPLPRTNHSTVVWNTKMHMCVAF